MIKICSKCNIEKDLTEFSKNRGECKLCIKEYNKIYRAVNKEKMATYDKQYRIDKKDTICEQRKLYRQTEKCKEIHDKWIEDNKEKYKEYKYSYNKIYSGNRARIDELFKFKRAVQSLVKSAYDNTGYKKNTKTEMLIGCTYEEFKNYIINQFETWMKLDNHGKYTGNYNETWQYDHIVPLFTAKSEADIIKLNHYTNIRPLCSRKNMEKRYEDNLLYNN